MSESTKIILDKEVINSNLITTIDESIDEKEWKSHRLRTENEDFRKTNSNKEAEIKRLVADRDASMKTIGVKEVV